MLWLSRLSLRNWQASGGKRKPNFCLVGPYFSSGTLLPLLRRGFPTTTSHKLQDFLILLFLFSPSLLTVWERVSCSCRGFPQTVTLLLPLPPNSWITDGGHHDQLSKIWGEDSKENHKEGKERRGFLEYPALPASCSYCIPAKVCTSRSNLDLFDQETTRSLQGYVE